MAFGGGEGETRQALAQALHLDGMDRDEVNRGNAALLEARAERELEAMGIPLEAAEVRDKRFSQ